MACVAAKPRQRETQTVRSNHEKTHTHVLARGVFSQHWRKSSARFPPWHRCRTLSPSAPSIRRSKVKRADLPTLAKISLDDAMKAAQVKVPGTVISADLKMKLGQSAVCHQDCRRQQGHHRDRDRRRRRQSARGGQGVTHVDVRLSRLAGGLGAPSPLFCLQSSVLQGEGS